MRTSNPILSDKAFNQYSGHLQDRMTLNGTVNKTAILLFIAVMCAAWPWSMISGMAAGQTTPPMLSAIMILGGIVGFVLALIVSFKPHTAPYLAPAYAACQGLFLGAISGFFEIRFPGIVLQAIALTFGTLASLLLAYKSGWIRATENFKLGVVAATGAIALFYLVSFIASFFGVNMSFMRDSSLLSIGISAVVVVVAALNLVLDFDFIESGVENNNPKHMEWYGAFGLVVTLFWLYVEILRLLSKLRSR